MSTRSRRWRHRHAEDRARQIETFAYERAARENARNQRRRKVTHETMTPTTGDGTIAAEGSIPVARTVCGP